MALIDAAVGAGYVVAAPAHERFDGKSVTDAQMRERVIGIADALRAIDRDDLPVVAAGHSAGGWAALCLAGAQPRGQNGQRISVPVESRVAKVIAMAPPLGWFRAPHALDRLTAPVTVMSGDADVVTPPETVDVLGAAAAQLTHRTYKGVGHLDFLSALPPGVSPTPGLDHEQFSITLARDFAAELR
ncbi:hypothetical protein [Curtobacterium sp. BH-2-1-1]|uniref:hypothetical protein n=1 Tax=Curtobacterium sp. BH-2-1-1 TaxID=1905847 RepID=UPI0011A5D491|nr:hypothetical protein [Curtobacterium sp. BH-2-1-1]